MLNFILRPILTLIILEIECCFGGECKLSLHRDLPKQHEPLYFIQKKRSFDLYMPHMIGEDGVIRLQEGQQILLACPGQRNRLNTTRTETALAECVGGVTLSIDKKPYLAYQLECEYPVQPLIHITDKKCGYNGCAEVRIGFQSPALKSMPAISEDISWFNVWKLIKYVWRLAFPRQVSIRTHWINLVTTCHNFDKSESLYSTHIVYGKTLAGAEMKWMRPQFTIGNNKLYQGFNPDNFYKKVHQRNILRKLLGKEPMFNYMAENFLTRGHLSPDADFVFGSWQYTTYTYVNSAPQWYSINAGNWQLIERTVRNFAIRTGSNLLVITGTHEILSLRSYNDLDKKVYLHPAEKKLPVPKYFWKIIQDPEKKACISFVCVNNPFIMKNPKKLCNEVSPRSGWPVPSKTSYSMGYYYCCETNDLRAKIPIIPKLECLSLLVGPKAFYNYRTCQNDKNETTK